MLKFGLQSTSCSPLHNVIAITQKKSDLQPIWDGENSWIAVPLLNL
jgi:hypothetical protein